MGDGCPEIFLGICAGVLRYRIDFSECKQTVRGNELALFIVPDCLPFSGEIVGEGFFSMCIVIHKSPVVVIRRSVEKVSFRIDEHQAVVARASVFGKSVNQFIAEAVDDRDSFCFAVRACHRHGKTKCRFDRLLDSIVLNIEIERRDVDSIRLEHDCFLEIIAIALVLQQFFADTPGALIPVEIDAQDFHAVFVDKPELVIVFLRIGKADQGLFELPVFLFVRFVDKIGICYLVGNEPQVIDDIDRLIRQALIFIRHGFFCDSLDFQQMKCFVL